MEAPMRNRRAPKVRPENLLAEAIDYTTAVQLIAVALFSLKDDRAKAVHTVSWGIGNRLESLRRLLKARGRIS
jgi:hypothetical protein